MRAALLTSFSFLTILLGATEISDPSTPNFHTSLFPLEGKFTLAFDDFRSLPEGSWEGNMGAFTSLYFKADLTHTLFLHFGGSYGLYDWMGRSSTSFENSSGLQQQGFLTGALSRETDCNSGFNLGLSYDAMLNVNFGEFAVNPYLSQVRLQTGYSIQGNEIGIWGTIFTNNALKESQQIPFQFRAISQANLFYCHYFKNTGYAMIWAGMPYIRSLMYTTGLPGTFIVGARLSAPLTDYLSINGHAAYMGARNKNGYPSNNYSSNVCIALTYTFGKRQKQLTPYMSLADNTNFLVDTNQNQ